jgi:glyoxylase-like metal-dependent hydrolase (beta-lactamase superfamily II)
MVGPGGGRVLPYAVRELRDGAAIDEGDVRLTVLATPGPRPDHLAFLVGDGSSVLTGDLDGARGARSIPGPPDEAAWARSLARIAALDPRIPRLGGHPAGSVGS